MTAPEGGGPPGTGENGAAQASPGGGSRLLLKRLAGVMAEAGDGQQRMDAIVTLIASSMSRTVLAPSCTVKAKAFMKEK